MKVKIIDDNMDIKIISDDKNVKSMDASVDIFKNIELSTSTQCSNFRAMFDDMLKHFDITEKRTCELILGSKYCLAKEIPTHQKSYVIKENNDLDLSLENWLNDNIAISSLSSKRKKLPARVITVYDCKNEIDIITACLYHFIDRTHLLKQCPICKNWFITKNRIDQEYCSNKCKDKNKKRKPLTEEQELAKYIYNWYYIRSSEDSFIKEKTRKLKELKENKISLNQYIEWLKDIKTSLKGSNE